MGSGAGNAGPQQGRIVSGAVVTRYAERIANRIVSDIERRRGIGDEWDAIAPEIQTEIVEKWAALVLEVLDGAA